MSLPQFLADAGFKALNRAHQTIVHLTSGRVGGSALGMPVVELHTVGRKSGRPRSTMLTAPILDGDRVVLVASKGGDDRDPDWYRNLVANPEIELTMACRACPCGPAARHRTKRPSCGHERWQPTSPTVGTSAALSATSRWSSANRAERSPRARVPRRLVPASSRCWTVAPGWPTLRAVAAISPTLRSVAVTIPRAPRTGGYGRS